MVLSLFGARLVQLQGVDPGSYAAMAAAEGTVDVVLPAERGDILDRNGEPLADSIDGLMVVGRPEDDRGQGAGDRPVPRASGSTSTTSPCSSGCATRAAGSSTSPATCPSTLANDVLQEAEDRGIEGLSTRRDPVRTYPAHDIAANLVGFVGTDQPFGGLEQVFNKALSGKDGSEKYEVGAGNRIPLGDNTTVPAVDGQDLHTTIDRDLQWYTQRVLRQAVEDSGGALRHRGGHGLPHRRGPRAGRRPDVRRRRPGRLTGPGPPGPLPQPVLRAGLGREGAHALLAHRRRARSPRAPRCWCPASCPARTGSSTTTGSTA